MHDVFHVRTAPSTDERTYCTSTYTKTIINFKMHFFIVFFPRFISFQLFSWHRRFFFSWNSFIHSIHLIWNCRHRSFAPITHEFWIFYSISSGECVYECVVVFFCYSVGCRVSSLFGRSFGFFSMNLLNMKMNMNERVSPKCERTSLLKIESVFYKFMNYVVVSSIRRMSRTTTIDEVG